MAAVLAVAVLATGCTAELSGSAQPEPGRVTVTPAASTDPCAMLTTDEAGQLGLAGPGTPIAAQPSSRVPASCEWRSPDPEASLDDSVQVYYSTDLNIGEYFSQQPTGQEEFGGVSWGNYPSILGKVMCNLAVSLSDTSFVAITGQNFADPAKACDYARKAAPIVATHLPR
ncbi:DUF3558 domain-containing protein [Amycolatopsis acidicola]|uniref:DUF3558 domain-containing protein n=1 Tax=Amycolatopsis acidicola TaxID=2596893 RepID=A0A5N0VPS7_9PSEU|nr:DUF3558 family protein [Amycolatopsis acidicola]KAA9166842.1 DUF3558 domain-containing protein [Amycolatopsis acidicola]